MPRALLALFTATALFVAGCGSSDSPTTATPKDTQPIATCHDDIKDITVVPEAGAAPTVTFDKGYAVERTQCHVLTPGSGRAAKQGDLVVFDFLFLDGRTGAVYGTSYEHDDTAAVVLDTKLMRGVRTALTGAKAGSRVLVAISPEDGLGLKGGDPQNGLEKDDTLVLVVEVNKVADARAKGAAIAPVAGQPVVELADNGEPTITVPKTLAPIQLVTQLLIEGTGPVVQAGQTITVQYKGVLWGTGQEFGSTWTSTPTQFPIGTGGVIPAWDKGLVGQKVGSQVLLIVPPVDGYGAEGAPNSGISGTDTLVFVIDILDAR